MARTKVVEVENTHNRAGGTINPIDNIIALGELARKNNLYFHLDGARIWNASIETGISPADYAKHFDSISCCLSKGLGAPIGSIIAGSKDFIKEAYRVRKAWGGGMRQVGILASAGLFALKNNIPRLKEDHIKAIMLAEGLSKIPGLEIQKKIVQTNIVMLTPLKLTVDEFLMKSKDSGLFLGTGKVGVIRAVTHMDVSMDEIEEAIKIIEKIMS
jgi:threonine aldolase